MTWLDLLTLGGIALSISIAYGQGMILEISQALALFASGTLGLRMFRPVANFLHSSVFTGWTIGFLHKFSFFLIFIAVFLTIYSIGLTIERRAKEEHMIEKETDRRLGLVVGLFKTVWLGSLLLALFFYFEMVPARNVKEVRQGTIVSMLLDAEPLVKPTIYVMAPMDLAKDFIRVGYQGKKSRLTDTSKKKKSKKK